MVTPSFSAATYLPRIKIVSVCQRFVKKSFAGFLVGENGVASRSDIADRIVAREIVRMTYVEVPQLFVERDRGPGKWRGKTIVAGAAGESSAAGNMRTGKVIIVTAGSRGIGRYAAQSFAREGAKAAVVGRDDE